MAEFVYDSTSRLLDGYIIVSIALVIYLSFRRETRPISAVFVVLSVVLLLIARLPYIHYNAVINPDEAEMIATAKKFTIDFMPWRSVNTTSAGPLDGMVLMWPFPFGGEVTFASARLTGAVLMAGAWVFVFASLSRTVPGIRILASAIFLLFLASTNWYDYVHYSSEQLSVFLLAGTTWCALDVLNGNRQIPRIIFAGVLIGCTFFAKLQAAPIGAALGVCIAACLLMLSSSHSPTMKARLRACGFLAIGALAPAVLILVPVTVTGGFHDFWISYYKWNRAYQLKPITLHQVFQIAWLDGPYAWFVIGSAALVVSAVGVGLLEGARKKLRFEKADAISVGLALVMLGASYYSVTRSGRPVTHYLLFFLPPIALLAGLSWPRRTFVALRLPAFCLLLPVVAGLSLAFGTDKLRPTPLPWAPWGVPLQLDVVAPESLFDAGNLFSWAPTDHPVQIWGWSPEYYVLSGTAPATRDLDSVPQLVQGPLMDYFRQRFLKDFEKSPPAVFVDAAAPGSFGYTDVASIGRTFPPLEQKIKSNYTLMSKPDETCPRTYLRNDVYAKTNFVQFQRITASAYFDVAGSAFKPELVDDFTSYETCADYWLLPDGTTGIISLDFTKPEIVKRIRILNTRNGHQGNRRTLTARVELLTMTSVVLFSSELKVRPYPYWTVIPVPQLQGNSLRITIETFAGAGGGLNEVKVER